MIESTSNKLSFVIGETPVFPFNIRFFTPDDIHCYINAAGSMRELVQNTDFSVESKNDYSTGANVRLLLDPLPSGATLTIVRQCRITQELALPENGKLPSAGMENAFDKLTMITQQLAEQIERSIKVGVSETDVSPDALLNSIYASGNAAVKAGEAAVKASAEAVEASAEAVEASAEAVEAAQTAKDMAGEIAGYFDKTAGLPVGVVFPFPASVPPEGAYLLNGQTIADCEVLYPKFWEWLTSQIGEYKTVNVYKPWTQPTLTENGTMGGDTYACAYSQTMYQAYYPYYSFNNNRSDTLIGLMYDASGANTGERTLTYYSPVKLKVSQIDLKVISVETHMIKDYTIEASTNGTSWTTIYTGTIETADLVANKILQCVIPEDKQGDWQYIRLNASSTHSNTQYTWFPKVFITAQQFDHTKQESTGAIRAINADEFERELSEYGVCGAFVVSGSSVRLPKWDGYSKLTGDIIPARGTGMALGFEGYNHLSAGLSTMNTYNQWTALSAYAGAEKTAVGTPLANGDKIYPVNHSVGVTTDTSWSGIVADASDISVRDSFHWCIQVYNAATALSEQESAQLASEMQMKAQTDLGNVTNPTQGFKDMAIGWGMPDYSAGVDISSNFAAPNSSYTVPCDCCIIGVGAGTIGVVLYSKGGCSARNLADWNYILLMADGDQSTHVYAADKVYLQKGTTVYCDIESGNLGKTMLYPLKGAN